LLNAESEMEMMIACDDTQICELYDWIAVWVNVKRLTPVDAALRVQENLEAALQDYLDDHQEENK